MLMKEYRICLPMTVNEYRLAQLFMIQKKSRTESAGAGSGVEIIKNEPYENGPGNTSGQYTYKLYHIGSHLPGWLRAILPKTALIVEEEAWNAYPYTRTIYRCKFIDKFSIDIETRYYDDAGEQDNVFGVPDKELRDRGVDFIDIVDDEMDASEYHEEEDPCKFRSAKTGRGPLPSGWRKSYKAEQDRTKSSAADSDSLWNYEFGKYPTRIMCAYKLCRVEFRYWGMQTRIERFIHDIGLRRTMVRAHRQAWCWQDEYFGLCIDDIRQLELETQRELAQKMEAARLLEQQDGETLPAVGKSGDATSSAVSASSNNANAPGASAKTNTTAAKPDAAGSRQLALPLDTTKYGGVSASKSNGSFATAPASPLDGLVDDEEDEEEDDDELELPQPHLTRALSAEDEFYDARDYLEQATDASSHTRRRSSKKKNKPQSSVVSGATHILLVVYADIESLYNEAREEQAASYPGFPSTMSECVEGFVSKMHSVLSQSGVQRGAVAIETVDCTSVLRTFVASMASITMQQRSASVDTDSALDAPFCMNDVSHIAQQGLIAALLCANSSSTVYQNRVLSVANLINNKLSQHVDLSAPEHDRARVFIVADGFTSPIVYDSLLLEQQLSKQSGKLLACKVHSLFACNSPLAQVLAARKFDRSASGCAGLLLEQTKLYNVMYAIHPFAYRVESALIGPEFRFVSPVQIARCGVRENPLSNADSHARLDIGATITRHKRLFAKHARCDSAPPKADDLRFSQTQDVEPALREKFQFAWHLDRLDYTLYHPVALNDLSSNTIFQFLQTCVWDSRDLIAFVLRSCVPGGVSAPDRDADAANQLHLAVPVSVSSSPSPNSSPRPSGSESDDKPEKWLHRRTSVKARSAAPNHRANDALINANAHQQTLFAKFIYGSLDVAALSGEKVDVYLVHYAATRTNLQSTPVHVQRGFSGKGNKKDSRVEHSLGTHTSLHKVRSAVDLRDDSADAHDNGKEHKKKGSKWNQDLEHCVDDQEQLDLLGTEMTDSNGKLAFVVPQDKRLGVGLHTIRMIVRGDRSAVQFRAAVVPDGTECVVFSIDGSLTASLSVTGGNPKVRPAAMDIVRFWQQLGYLVLYITARPDIQTRRVSHWLFRHNFPPGLIMFMDHLSIDALRHKAEHLRKLAADTRIAFHCAYGSKKDIAVYRTAGVPPNRVYAVGCSKQVSNPKLTCFANILPAGYVEHLEDLRDTLNAKANRTSVQNSSLNELVKSAKFQWNRLVGF